MQIAKDEGRERKMHHPAAPAHPFVISGKLFALPVRGDVARGGPKMEAVNLVSSSLERGQQNHGEVPLLLLPHMPREILRKRQEWRSRRKHGGYT